MLLTLALTACGTSARLSQGSVELTVGNFNLRGDLDRGDNSWAMRRPRALDRIRAAGYDLFGTEECYGYMLEDVRREVSEYEFYGQCTGDRTGTYSALFYRKDRFDLLDKGDFWMSDTPDRISNGWDLNHLRICSWGKLRDRASGRVFFFFNTHLDNDGRKSAPEAEELRTRCTRLILSRIRAIAGDAPVLLTGDLNDPPEREAIRLLTIEGALQDAFVASETAPEGPVGTFHDYKPSLKNDWRIDYILASPQFRIRSYRCVDTDLTEGHCASDHYSILAKLVLK